MRLNHHMTLLLILLFFGITGCSEKPSEQQGSAAPDTVYSFWPDPVSPTFPYYNNPDPIEMGLKFQTSVPGTVTGVRFFKADGATGTHIGRLWNMSGDMLADVTFTNETASGWQEAFS